MSYPALLDLCASRWTPFDETLEFDDVDLTGATARMSVRTVADAPGDALVDLTGLGFTVATLDDDPTSFLRVQIPVATVKALPAAAEPGADSVLAYDIQITPAGQTVQVWVRGSFIVKAGVVEV